MGRSLDESDDYWHWAVRQPDSRGGWLDIAWIPTNGEMFGIEYNVGGMHHVCKWDSLPTRDTIYRPEDDA